MQCTVVFFQLLYTKKISFYIGNLPDEIFNLAQEQNVLQYTQSDEDTE